MHRSVVTAGLVAAALMVHAAPARAQVSSLDTERDSYMRDRAGLMVGLSVWSALNIGAGTYFLLTEPRGKLGDPRDRSFRRGFWSMALVYGLINGALAAGTLATLSRERGDHRFSPPAVGRRIHRKRGAGNLHVRPGRGALQRGLAGAGPGHRGWIHGAKWLLVDV